MSRLQGTTSFPVAYEPEIASPFDARMKVGLKSDLINPKTWESLSGAIFTYIGMLTVVSEDTPENNGIYWLSDTDYTNIENWKRASQGRLDGDGLPDNLVYIEAPENEQDCSIIGEIIDSLESERADAALSAQQGKILCDTTVRTVGYTDEDEGKILQVIDGEVILSDIISEGMDPMIKKRIQRIEDILFPISNTGTLSPGGLQEEGNNVNITINGALIKDGAEIEDCKYYIKDKLITRPFLDTVNKSTSYSFKGVTPEGIEKSKTLSISFSNRYYWGVVDVFWTPTEGNIKKLNNELSLPATKTKVFTATGQRIVFASLTKISKFIDGNNFDNVSSFDYYPVQITNAFGVTYTSHVYVFNETITQENFSITFKE